MKKVLLYLILVIASIKPVAAQSKDAAKASQSEGVYGFFESQPTREYEVLGTVKKTGLVWSGKPQEMYRIILRRAKKDYPTCDALLPGLYLYLCINSLIFIHYYAVIFKMSMQ